MKPDFYIDCLEPGADNSKEHAPVPAPDPPEGFVDNTVYRYKLVDGKEVLIGTMEAFPEGWHRSKTDWEKGFQKQSKEDEEMAKKDIDFGVIVARAQEVAAERGISLYKASGIVAKETGLHRNTVYNHARAMLQTPTPAPAAAANQEPERESQEPAENSVTQEESEITVCEAAQREQGFGPEDDEPIPYQVVEEDIEDKSLDDMKVIWIQTVMENSRLEAKTKLRYIGAIAELRA